MIIKTRAVLDRGRARRDQAAPSLRAAGAARPADRGRQRRILQLDRQARREARAGDERALRARHRSGHDQHARHAVRRPHATMRHRAGADHADLPGSGRGRARPGGDLALGAPGRTCRARRGQVRRGCRHRHHQSARDHGRVGEGDRQARSPMPLSGRTAAPHRLCADLTREGWGAHVTEVTGLIIDPYFSATKLAWLLRHVPGLEARARRRRGLLRHRRQLPAVQAHRRQATCNRRHQRRAHHALRHQVRPMG